MTDDLETNESRDRTQWAVIALLFGVCVSSVFVAWTSYAIATDARASQKRAAAELRAIAQELRGIREFVKAAEGDARRARQWEYRVAVPSDFAFESSMAEYGREGWELVTARRASSEGDMAYEMILKRPNAKTATVSAPPRE